jgi:hypothetical protein
MLRLFAFAAVVLALAACVAKSGDPPPPAPLANDATAPELALFEHVLKDHFAATGARGPTTCAMLRPRPLAAAQERALIERFARLAPASRCVAAGSGWQDAVTREPAQLIEVYEFACPSPDKCTGWVSRPGRPAQRYAMRFQGGSWRFTADPRRLAE